MVCWYAANCPMRADGCEGNCPKFSQVSFLMESSQLPKALRSPIRLVADNCDVAAFDRLSAIARRAREFAEGGGSLYITSATTGNGKTSWAAKILQNYLSQIWAGNNYEPRGFFVSVPRLLSAYARQWGDEGARNFVSGATEMISKCGLAVWDDIGATQLTQGEQKYLQGLVDLRAGNGLASIYTGNMRGAPLAQALGVRLFSRVETASEVVVLAGRDKRGTASGD